MAGSVKVIRSGGGLGESSTSTTNRVVSRTAGVSGKQRIDMALGSDAEQMDVEIRRRIARLGIRGQNLLVRQGGGGQVVAELSVGRGHGVHVAGRDVDVIQQGLASLLVVAFVVILGDVSVVAPEQVHLRPVDPPGLRSEETQQLVAVAAAGQHDLRLAARSNRSVDDTDQPFARRGHQSVAVVERFH